MDQSNRSSSNSDDAPVPPVAPILIPSAHSAFDAYSATMDSAMAIVHHLAAPSDATHPVVATRTPYQSRHPDPTFMRLHGVRNRAIYRKVVVIEPGRRSNGSTPLLLAILKRNATFTGHMFEHTTLEEMFEVLDIGPNRDISSGAGDLQPTAQMASGVEKPSTTE